MNTAGFRFHPACSALLGLASWCGAAAAAQPAAGAANQIIGAGVHAPGWCRTAPLDAAHTSAVGGCPELGVCDAPEVRDAAIPAADQPILAVRMKVHVFTGEGGLDPAVEPAIMAAQIAQLNSDFLPARIQFAAAIEYHAAPQFRVFTPPQEAALKAAYAEQPERQINVYVVENLAGFSTGTFPWTSEALTFMGGIVLHSGHAGANASVLSHEVGHVLGLWHTHHGVSEVSGCQGCHEGAGETAGDHTGDRCSDTAPTPINFFCGPPGGVDPCTGQPWGATNYHNYMSYTQDHCRDEFTPQQVGRMHCWLGLLADWVCPDCLSPGACCTAAEAGFECRDAVEPDCAGTFLGAGTRCADLPGGDRCDCNANSVLDLDEIEAGRLPDCTGNLVPDVCEPDCDASGTADSCEIARGTSTDCDSDGVPDQCTAASDCNANGERDPCDIAGGASADCDRNGVPDECDLTSGVMDCDADGVLDSCEPDCNANSRPDDCDIADGSSVDGDANGRPDECQRVWHVDAAAPPGGSGAAWESALIDLQLALQAAGPGDQIWVRAGVYRPGMFPDRGASFELPCGVALYGGFAGNEHSPGQRDLQRHRTELSGDLAGNDGVAYTGVADNAFHVLTIQQCTAPTVLDGFTIRGGNANGLAPPHDGGGGIRVAGAALTVRNSVFQANSGRFGGACQVLEGTLRLSHCHLEGNRAYASGGAIHSAQGVIAGERCAFVENTASADGGALALVSGDAHRLTHCRLLANLAERGGGLATDQAFVQLDDCQLRANSADIGGAMYDLASRPLLVGCTLHANHAEQAGGGFYGASGSRPRLSSCVLWRNRDASGTGSTAQLFLETRSEQAAVEYSCVQGGWLGPGNIAADPLLRDPDGAGGTADLTSADLGLLGLSPCINAGDPQISGPAVDLEGHPRVLCGRRDMGAHEFGAGDYDCDGAVDRADFAAWRGCARNATAGGCEALDFDADGDVDLADFGQFQRTYTGDCPIHIIIQPETDPPCLNQPLILAVLAEGPGLTYRWRRDDEDIPGATGPFFGIAALQAHERGSYRCIISASCGAEVPTQATEVTATTIATVIRTSPQGGTYCTGDDVVLFVEASGDPVYEWRRNGEPIAGAHSATLLLSHVSAEDAGAYQVVCSNDCSSDTSPPAVINILACDD